MLDLANDIRSLSDFKRNTADHLIASELGISLVVTIDGKAKLVVHGAEAYPGPASTTW